MLTELFGDKAESAVCDGAADAITGDQDYDFVGMNPFCLEKNQLLLPS